MKIKHLPILGFLTVPLILPAVADTIYSDLKNISIPTTYDGVYLSLLTGETGTSDASPPASWGLNATKGGQVVLNSPNFQPVRNADSSIAPIVSFTLPGTIHSGLLFTTEYGGTGYGASDTHVGTTFTANSEAYLGFRLDANNNPLAPAWKYGWMRVVLYDNTGTVGAIKDWAYDDSGGSILIGRVHQGAAVEGAQTVTLSPQGGESFTLGSAITDTNGDINSVIKTGAGTTSLGTTNGYTGTTIISSGTLTITSGGSINTTSAVAIGAGEFNYNSGIALSQSVSFSGTGGILSGTGTITPAVTVAANNTHSPGSIGGTAIQEFSNGLAYAANSIFSWDLASGAVGLRGSQYDAVNLPSLSGSATDAIFKVVLDTGSFSDPFWDSNRTWSDIFMNGDSPLAFDSFFRADNIEWWEAGINMTGSAGADGYFSTSGNTLLWTAVPEPTGALAGLLLACGLLPRRR